MATVQAVLPSSETAPAGPAHTEAPKDVVEEKAVVPPTEAKADDSKALTVAAEKAADDSVKKITKGSLERDLALAELEKEKKLSLIKAWEDSEKSKVENRAQKKLSEVGSWENTKKAAIESQLKKMEEKLEQTKADYAEKMKNKVASLHKEADEKRAMVQARKGEELLKAQEMAAKYRAYGHVPKKMLGCFGG